MRQTNESRRDVGDNKGRFRAGDGRAREAALRRWEKVATAKTEHEIRGDQIEQQYNAALASYEEWFNEGGKADSRVLDMLDALFEQWMWWIDEADRLQGLAIKL
jgi:hypothetical protein